MSWKEALTRGREMDVLVIPYELAEGMERTKEIFSHIRPGQSVGIFIGPEEVSNNGKWSRQSRRLCHHPWKTYLRTETAGLAALSILMYHLEG